MTAGSPFVGRRAELAEVSELLRSFPVVTITGPGGIGKTRLATEVAARTGESFTGGTLVADLATVGPDDDVTDAIARQLSHESIDAVRVAAIGRPTLVIIDDCERMLDQVRPVVADLVEGDADIVVLATSRSSLDLAGSAGTPSNRSTPQLDPTRARNRPQTPLYGNVPWRSGPIRILGSTPALDTTGGAQVAGPASSRSEYRPRIRP